jgi:hypothetical protein
MIRLSNGNWKTNALPNASKEYAADVELLVESDRGNMITVVFCNSLKLRRGPWPTMRPDPKTRVEPAQSSLHLRTSDCNEWE